MTPAGKIFCGPLVACARMVWLLAVMAIGTLRYLSGRAGASWLHQLCRGALRVFGAQVHVQGQVPAGGLLVANHLGYLDIIVLASLRPCVFVAKSDVSAWPVFGWFALQAGTIFINRRNRADVVRAANEIRTALKSGALVVLFPEGTSSDGTTVLPFKSSLLEAAIGGRLPIHACALNYELADGDAAEEVCYWGHHTLVPHFFRLFTKSGVRASLSFAKIKNTWRDRKKLAAQLHAQVSALHEELNHQPCRHLSGVRSAFPTPHSAFSQGFLTSTAAKT